MNTLGRGVSNALNSADVINQVGRILGITPGSALPSSGYSIYSDERLKKDVEHVGMTHEGTPIYTYRMKGGGPKMMGVMAQDVPEAASMDERVFLMVDYDRVR